MWGATRAAAQRLFEVVDSQPAVAEQAVPKVADTLSRPAGTLEVSDLSFRYPGQDRPALDRVSLRLEPGRLVAIVGPSGAGKSTLASLLLRFWEFDQGEICLGGRSNRSCSPDEVRSQIAVVPPNPYFFNTSIYENLRMARRRVTKEEVEQAAEAAQIHAAIVKLPKGYETLIGEQGLRLSGGERQRISIARALLYDPRILVLDEATSSVDTESEQLIQEALMRVTAGRTTIAIAHRLSTLKNSDRIIVMDDGKVIEQGTHEELLALGGMYYKLVKIQTELSREPSVDAIAIAGKK
jgi:ABC-type multidrug transport system fused ATPase/permease subunit